MKLQINPVTRPYPSWKLSINNRLLGGQLQIVSKFKLTVFSLPIFNSRLSNATFMVTRLKFRQNVLSSYHHLDWGKTFFMNKNIAFSAASWILRRIIHMNCATEMSLGTRNFLLSISWIWEFGAFSTITGILSGYFARILADSLALTSEISSHHMQRVNSTMYGKSSLHNI